MHKPTNVLNIISYICLILAVVAVASILYLRQSNTDFFSVQSASMSPALSTHDLILTKHTNDYSVGDIITFKNNDGAIITHRIVAMDDRTLTTKGDSNQSQDKPIAHTQIIGEVTQSIPFAGAVVNQQNPYIALFVLIYLPALFIIISETKRLTLHLGGTIYSLYTKPKRRSQHAMRQVSVIGLIMVVAVSVLSKPVFAQFSSSAQLTGNTITAVVPAVVNEICLFPGDRALLSYSALGARFPQPQNPALLLANPIEPGSYTISMDSFDTHVAVVNQITQPNERWFMEFYNQAGELVAQTQPTDDLPNNLDTITTIHSLEIPETVYSVRYVHEAVLSGLESEAFNGRPFDDLTYQEKRQVFWNSIHPGCVQIY